MPNRWAEMTKYNSSDVETLAQYFIHAKESGAPFALLTGAGCSVSAGIPGAASLVDEINQTLAFCLGGLTEEERKDYGKCMGCLPEDMQRKLLKPYLDNAKVNWGHIAIAGLMREGYLGKILTFNFDNVLARACGLVGLYPATYDFAAAPTDTFSHISETAIMHLHGQGHGFFMFNSEEKTKVHAERLSPLLKDVFDKNPILVIGYSGSSDSVFSRIRTIFSGRNALFWAGHSEKPNSHVSRLVAGAGRTARYLGGVDADRFLLELAIKLDCLPELFRDPYGHLLFELSDVTDYPLTGDVSKDVLAEVRSDLIIAQQTKTQKGPSIVDLFVEGKWSEVLEKYNSNIPQDSDFAYWAQLAIADAEADLAHKSTDHDQISKMNTAFEKATKMAEDRNEAWHNWGAALDTLGGATNDDDQLTQATSKFEEALKLNPNDSETLVALGTNLCRRAERNGDKVFFEKSVPYFRKALELSPNEYNSNYSIGYALSNIAELNSNSDITLEAINHINIALQISPDNQSALQLLASSYSDVAKNNKDTKFADKSMETYLHSISIDRFYPELMKNAMLELSDFGDIFSDPKYYLELISIGRDIISRDENSIEILDLMGHALARVSDINHDTAAAVEARSLLHQSERLTGKPSYNLACGLVQLGFIDEAKDKLLACKSAQTLPDANHLRLDDDLKRLRGLDWFDELSQSRDAP